MKSSTILKLVLEKYYSEYDSTFPGICENVTNVIYGTLDYSGKEGKILWYKAMDFVDKYKPHNYGVYWWPTDDVETRIEVLQRAIVDAEQQGD